MAIIAPAYQRRRRWRIRRSAARQAAHISGDWGRRQSHDYEYKNRNIHIIRCFNKKWIVFFVVMCTAVICGMLYYDKSHSTPIVGWRTVDSTPEPFKAGILTNGQPPADFEVTLVEPEFHSRIKAKPADRCRFLVKIRLTDTDKPNSDEPPTHVFLKLVKKSNVVNAIELKPFAKDGRSFLYSGEVEAPQKVGDYDVVIEVQYVIFDGSDGVQLKHLDPFRKTVKGATLHVSN